MLMATRFSSRNEPMTCVFGNEKPKSPQDRRKGAKTTPRLTVEAICPLETIQHVQFHTRNQRARVGLVGHGRACVDAQHTPRLASSCTPTRSMRPDWRT
jgi:hypothetical protein